MDTVLEEAAHHYAARLILAQSQPGIGTATANPASVEEKKEDETSKDYQAFDINSLEILRPRGVGVEHVALSVWEELGLTDKLHKPGVNTSQLNAIIGLVVARRAVPGSELSTHTWLQNISGLGKLLGWDFECTSLTQLYQVTDLLLNHKESLEKFLFEREKRMLGLE